MPWFVLQFCAVNCNQSCLSPYSTPYTHTTHTHTHTHTPGDRYDPEPRSRSQHRHADKSKEESFYDEDPRGPIGRRDNGDVSGRAYKDRDVTSRPYRDASPEEEEEEEEEKNEEKQQ